MSTQISTQHIEDAHTDLLATLAASRELGPEMDRALVESYFQKHPIAAHNAPAAAQSTGGARLSTPQVLGGIGFLMGATIFIAALIASGGHAFWLLWLPLALGGWWWRWWPLYGGWGYHGYRMDQRARRQESAEYAEYTKRGDM
jgi:hypothetical protein